MQQKSGAAGFLQIPLKNHRSASDIRTSFLNYFESQPLNRNEHTFLPKNADRTKRQLGVR